MIVRLLPRLVMVLSVGAVICGCAQMRPAPHPKISLLEEYKTARSWSAAQTESAVNKDEQRYAQSPTDENRLCLALALGFGKGAATDTRRALQLFDETAKSAATPNSDEALFAEVFADILRERLQSESRLSTAEARITVLSKQSEKERERAEELEKKLEAIKVIEKSLRKR